MVSVALCTYNGQQFLSEQLFSILNQTMPVDEIVICDDGSTDSTRKLLQHFTDTSSIAIRIHYNSETLKPVQNFKKAIGLCKGQYIFLSDQDDVWHLDKVKKIVEAFNNRNVDMVFTDARLIDNQGNLLNSNLWESVGFSPARQSKWLSEGALVDLLYKKSVVTGATAAVTSQMAKLAFSTAIPEGIWHDEWLAIHAAVKNRLVWLPLQLTDYRIHASQQLGIGNGVEALKTSDYHTTLKKIISDVNDYYVRVKSLTENLGNQYYFPQKNSILTDTEKWLEWCTVRLNLPSFFFQRLLYILRNYSSYKIKKNYQRDILRDIIKPS